MRTQEIPAIVSELAAQQWHLLEVQTRLGRLIDKAMACPLELTRAQHWDELDGAVSSFAPKELVFPNDLPRLRRQLILSTREIRQRLAANPGDPAGLRILLDLFRAVTFSLRNLEQTTKAGLSPMHFSRPSDAQASLSPSPK